MVLARLLQNLSYMRPPDPRGEKLHQLKRALYGVTIEEQLHTKTRRRWKPIFISRLRRRTKRRINFYPFQIALYDSFVTGFQ